MLLRPNQAPLPLTPAASGCDTPAAPDQQPSPQTIRLIEEMRTQLEDLESGLEKDYAQHGEPLKGRERAPVKKEMPGSSLLTTRPGLKGMIATVTFRDADSGIVQYWDLKRNSPEVEQIAVKAARYASLQKNLRNAEMAHLNDARSRSRSTSSISQKNPLSASLSSLQEELLIGIAKQLDKASVGNFRLVSIAMDQAGLSATTALVIDSPDDLADAAIWYRHVAIRKITLEGRKLWSRHLAPLKQFGHLRELIINCRQMDNDCLLHLPPWVEELGIAKCMPTNFWIPRIPGTVKKLHLNHSSLTNDYVPKLPPLLEELYCRSCANLDDGCVPNIPRGVKKLDLSYRKGFTDACVPHLPPEVEELSFAAFEGYGQLTDACIPKIPRTVTKLNVCHSSALTSNCAADLPDKLVDLSIAGCPLLGDTFILGVPRTVKSLDISENPNFTNGCAPNLPGKLIALSIAGCPQLGDEFIRDLPRDLETLNASDCPLLTDECIPLLPPGLKEVKFAHCWNISREAIDNLAQRITVKTL